jgi:hypothetical protein
MGYENQPQYEGSPIINLDREVAAILGPKGIEAPPIQVHVTLQIHSTKENARELQEELAQCNLFIPEMASNFSKDRIKVLNLLSQGKITPIDAAQRLHTDMLNPPPFSSIDAILASGYTREFCRIVHGCKKPIGIVDYDLHESRTAKYKGAGAEENLFNFRMRRSWNAGLTLGDAAQKAIKVQQAAGRTSGSEKITWCVISLGSSRI